MEDNEKKKVCVIYKKSPAQSDSARTSGHRFRLLPVGDDEDGMIDRIDDFLNANLSENGRVVFFDVVRDKNLVYHAVLVCKT